MEPRAALLSLLSTLGTGECDLVIDDALVRMVDHLIPARALKVVATPSDRQIYPPHSQL